jgi:protein SCO1/2
MARGIRTEAPAARAQAGDCPDFRAAKMGRSPWLLLPIALLAVFSARQAAGQTDQPPAPPGFDGAAVVERPDAQVPLDLEFVDEDGKEVRLGDYFKPNRPVLLVMVYFRCPMLCGLTLNGIVKAVKPLPLAPGRDFEMVTVCFDPREGPDLAKARKAVYLEELGRPEAAAGWHFLTSSKASAARTLGDAIGFGYKLDPKGQMYLHQAAIYVCTPEGRVARVLQGIEYEPDVLRDSLIQASRGKISRGLFGVALSCGLFHYDPDSGKYTWAVMGIMRVTGILTVLVLASAIGTLIYRDTRRRRAAPTGNP